MIKIEWFNKLFKKGPKNTKFAPNLSGFEPIFSQFGTNIYLSDVVRQALKCIADEIKKSNPMHVRYINNDPSPVKSTIQDVLENPNELMTTSEFLEKITYLLLMNYNVFIIPTYYTWIDDKTGQEKRYYKSLYPINPIQVDFIEDLSEKIYVKFLFRNGETTTIRYDDVIHIRYNYSVNEYMGGNNFGQPDNEALLESLNLNRELLKGISKAMKASYSVNGIVKYNTLLDDGRTEQAILELENKLKNSESGFLPLDLKSEFTPIIKNANLIDDKVLKFIDGKILRTWGIPIEILMGNYTKEIYESFYQKAIEPLVKSFSQAFTKKLFTSGEKSYGNKIEFYTEDLIFMTMTQKIELVNLLSPTGALFENEKRRIFGLTPLEELDNKRFMSLNWISADKAEDYQLGKVNINVVDENKEVSEV